MKEKTYHLLQLGSVAVSAQLNGVPIAANLGRNMNVERVFPRCSDLISSRVDTPKMHLGCNLHVRVLIPTKS